MTLVIGIATQKGVVLGADGLATLGGGIQTPATKLFAIGNCFAVGISGDAHLGIVLAQALQNSPLAQMLPAQHSKEQATTAARDAIRAAIIEYVKHIAFNEHRPVPEQIGSAHLMLTGPCSDGALLVTLDQTGNFYPPAMPNYSAIGSGATPALLLLKAYSKYDYAEHPLETSILLAKRIMDMVSEAIAEIGGQISTIAISFTPDTNGECLRQVDLGSPEIRAGMETWELLEDEMFDNLAGRVRAPAGTTRAGAAEARIVETVAGEPAPAAAPAPDRTPL